MKRGRDILVNIIGVVMLVVIIIFGVNEFINYNNKVDWEPTEVYPMANQNISWD